MTTGRKENIRIGIVAALVIIGFIAAGRFLPLGEWLGLLNRWTSDRGAVGVLVFSAIYILAVLLLLPSSVFTMSAGVTYGLLGGTLLSLVSATFGAAIAFVISRCCAHAPAQHWLNRNRRLKALDRAISEHEWKVVFLFRLAPVVPFGPVNYSLGLSNVRFWTYITATATGILPGTFLYTYAGYAGYAFFGNGDTHTTLQYALIAGGLVVAIILVVFLGRIAKRALDDIDRKTA
ncbi:MAG: TVP38/TMEM64 family protein [Verrucomicrobia bacterium]|nr:TVP38/TMEM64 family protein [Verrucomicrobiota bacterium]